MQAAIGANLVVQSPGTHMRALQAMATFERKGQGAKAERVVPFYAKGQDAIWLPRGLWPQVYRLTGATIQDRRLRFQQTNYGWRGQLREDQAKLQAQVLEKQGGILVCPTGYGKTPLGLSILAAWGQPTLILVNREQIALQWMRAIRTFLQVPGRYVDQVGEGKAYTGGRIVVAMVQSLHKDSRTVERLTQRMGAVLVDECFPAGTKVHGKQIETLRPGDVLETIDPDSGESCKVTVQRLLVRPAPERLVSVSAGGRKIICTPNHPIWTHAGWTSAGDITCADEILIGGEVDAEAKDVTDEPLRGLWAGIGESHSTSLLELPSCETEDKTQGTCSDHLHYLRSGVPVYQGAEGLSARDGSLLLLEGVWSQGEEPARKWAASHRSGEGNAPGILAQAWRHAPSEGPAISSESKCDDEGPRIQANGAWRERTATPRAATGTRGGAWLANRVGGANEDAARIWIPQLLQVGHCESGATTGNRGGRILARNTRTPSAGRQERGVPFWAGVDSVTFLEPGSDGTFGGVCPDGLVYNLEVDGPHTYLANGVLVHNCDGTPAKTIANVVTSFPGVFRLGLTATPARSDGLEGLMFALMGPGYTEMSYDEAFRLGVIVRPKVHLIASPLKVDEMPDWATLQRARAEDTDRNALICQLAAHLFQQGRKILIPLDLKEHGETVAKMLRQFFRVPAYNVDGEDPIRYRDRIAREMGQGKCVMIATSLADRGLDVPTCDAMILAAPGRSEPRVVQQAGRVVRTAPGKRDAHIYDICDVHTPTLKAQINSRLHAYRDHGFEVVRR